MHVTTTKTNQKVIYLPFQRDVSSFEGFIFPRRHLAVFLEIAFQRVICITVPWLFRACIMDDNRMKEGFLDLLNKTEMQIAETVVIHVDGL